MTRTWPARYADLAGVESLGGSLSMDNAIALSGHSAANATAGAGVAPEIGACYRVTMATQDGSTLQALFKLK